MDFSSLTQPGLVVSNSNLWWAFATLQLTLSSLYIFSRFGQGTFLSEDCYLISDGDGWLMPRDQFFHLTILRTLAAVLGFQTLRWRSNSSWFWQEPKSY